MENGKSVFEGLEQRHQTVILILIYNNKFNTIVTLRLEGLQESGEFGGAV